MDTAMLESKDLAARPDSCLDGAPLSLGFAPSPLGALGFALSGEALCALGFDLPEAALRALLRRRAGAVSSGMNAAVARVQDALARYFQGEVGALAALPVDGAGTDFQRGVWAALREIPAGETLSYGAIAARLGNPKAVRAVGLANGKNPIALAVPCHRVVGKSGAPTGYAWGVARKRWLLDHERAAMGSIVK